MQSRTGRSGWGRWLAGLVLTLAVALLPGLSLGQTLNVDGGATVSIPPSISYTNENVGVNSAGTIN